jgi:hypothetical protein
MRTNDYMLGVIALGVVIVDAPAGGPAAFTPFHVQNTLLEVYLGIELLNLLAVNHTPMHQRAFSFVVAVERVEITPTPGLQPPTGNANTFAAEIADREPHWRDPALNALGLSAGSQGVREHNDALLARSWPGGLRARWAYTLFVTRYHAGWLAYASPAGDPAKVVIQLDWVSDVTGNFNSTNTGGWSPFGIDRVFAHETGHIFGALDEYKGRKNDACSVTAVMSKPPIFAGAHFPPFQLSVPNMNCEAGNPLSVGCLMKHNTPALCPTTPSVFGWVDLDGDGALDFLMPRVLDVDPVGGLPNTIVHLRGVGFGDAKAVAFSGLPATTFTVISDTDIEVSAPNGTGPVDVTVTTSVGASPIVPGVTTFTFL